MTISIINALKVQHYLYNERSQNNDSTRFLLRKSGVALVSDSLILLIVSFFSLQWSASHINLKIIKEILLTKGFLRFRPFYLYIYIFFFL